MTWWAWALTAWPLVAAPVSLLIGKTVHYSDRHEGTE